MITTNIQIEEYLAQWLRSKWGDRRYAAVRLPSGSDLYCVLYDVMSRRPAGASPTDRGNVTLCLPDRREGDMPCGKNPETYNYISAAGAAILEKRVRALFWAEVHEEMDEQKHLMGVDYKDTAYQLCRRYDLTAISDDALLKNYQRWRDKMRRRRKREYVKTKKR